MTKLESLKKLKEIIENPNTNLAMMQYYDSCGDNCAIGHLLKIGGLTDEQLKEIDSGKYYNSIGIDIPIYSILGIMSDNIKCGGDDYVISTLESLGFNIEDKRKLSRLQQSNDDGNKLDVLSALNAWIGELEASHE